MAEAVQKAVASTKLSKKKIKKEIFEKLAGALSEYKNKLDKKKFESKLKKASKLFAVDLIKASKKTKKPAKLKKVVTEK